MPTSPSGAPRLAHQRRAPLLGVANETTEDDRGKGYRLHRRGAQSKVLPSPVSGMPTTLSGLPQLVSSSRLKWLAIRIEPVTVGVDVRWRGLTTRNRLNHARVAPVETIRGRETARATGAELAVGFHCAAVPAIATEGGFTPASLNAFHALFECVGTIAHRQITFEEECAVKVGNGLPGLLQRAIRNRPAI